MKISDLFDGLEYELLVGDNLLEDEVEAGYAGDLLSRVMTNAPHNGLWITIQTHLNIVAVASLLEIKLIVLAENVEADANTLKKAEEEGIGIIRTPLSAYELSGHLYNRGLRAE